MSGEITAWEIGATSVDEMGFSETGINRANDRKHTNTGLL